jgi:hypothetical protein
MLLFCIDPMPNQERLKKRYSDQASLTEYMAAKDFMKEWKSKMP